MIQDDNADSIWQIMQSEARQASIEQPLLADFLHRNITHYSDFASAASSYLASQFENIEIPSAAMHEIFSLAVEDNPLIVEQMLQDLLACKKRDPTCSQYIIPFLYFKGYHSLQIYRIAHWLWQQQRSMLANYFQSRLSALFDVDIHPAATLGSGIMLDHATGIVIGETAVIENDVSILHGVTLGGSGSFKHDRHPKVRRGVLLSAGARLFGNIDIGEGARIGAGSLVLNSVPAHVTVAGVPAKIIGKSKSAMPSLDMNHQIDEDVISEKVE